MMEELRKLEEMQRMLTLMHSQGLASDSDNDSNCFLANLIHLLATPCGNLHFNDKCSLIYQNLPKISASFVDEASLLFNPQREDKIIESHVAKVTSSVSDRKDNELKQNNFDDLAVVSLDAMQRANSTLEDFCRSYFMFHGMDINSPQSVFKYLPVLSFTESYIYQMDILNEKLVNLTANRVGIQEKMQEENANCMSKYMDVLQNDPFRPLVHQLKCNGLLTDRIMEEFKCGEEYWVLERKLCSAKHEVSVEDVMRAIHLKSFDYRVLNLLLYQLRREKVNELHVEFLSISEFLVEVSDDLFDYEEDVLENNFNILRMFVRIYGASATPVMLAKCIAEAEDKYNSLLKNLEPQLSSSYQRRCEEATKEGGKISGHPLGTWNIPPLIVDEESHRLNCLGS